MPWHCGVIAIIIIRILAASLLEKLSLIGLMNVVLTIATIDVPKNLKQSPFYIFPKSSFGYIKKIYVNSLQSQRFDIVLLNKSFQYR